MVALAVAGFTGGASWAARVDGLYSAEAALPGGSASSLNDAFSDALGKVLVKVTGRREFALDPELLGQFGNPRTLLQQYRVKDPDIVWTKFDRSALQRTLDLMGQPVWGADRPETLLWLAVDAGGGRREILGQAPELLDSPRELSRGLAGDMRGNLTRDLRKELERGMPAGLLSGQREDSPSAQSEDQPLYNLNALRDELLETAELRGIPLVLPLMDTEDLVEVGIADIWGGFNDPVVAASARYGVDAVLIGRARVIDAESVQVRWTLLLDDEQFDWKGDITEGPHGLADRFATRLASSVSGARQIRFSVTGIDTFSQYGAVANYLKTMAIVESCEVQRVSGGSVIFDLTVRGDEARLARTIALGRMLQPVPGSSAQWSENASDTDTWPSLDNSSPDLQYQLSGTVQ